MGADVTVYDLVIIGLFLVLVGRGLWTGFLNQVIGILSLYLGYLVAGQYHDRLFPFLKEVSTNPKVVFLTAYALLFIGAYLCFVLIGKGLSLVIKITLVGWFDRVLGGVLGFAKASLLVIMIHMILGTVLAPENRMLSDCQVCPTLNQVTRVTRNLIKDEKARDALMRNEVAIKARETVKKAKGLLEEAAKKKSSSVQ